MEDKKLLEHHLIDKLVKICVDCQEKQEKHKYSEQNNHSCDDKMLSLVLTECIKRQVNQPTRR